MRIADRRIVSPGRVPNKDEWCPAPQTAEHDQILPLGVACVLKGSTQHLVDQFMLSRREVGDDASVSESEKAEIWDALERGEAI